MPNYIQLARAKKEAERSATVSSLQQLAEEDQRVQRNIPFTTEAHRVLLELGLNDAFVYLQDIIPQTPGYKPLSVSFYGKKQESDQSECISFPGEDRHIQENIQHYVHYIHKGFFYFPQPNKYIYTAVAYALHWKLDYPDAHKEYRPGAIASAYDYYVQAIVTRKANILFITNSGINTIPKEKQTEHTIADELEKTLQNPLTVESKAMYHPGDFHHSTGGSFDNAGYSFPAGWTDVGYIDQHYLDLCKQLTQAVAQL